MLYPPVIRELEFVEIDTVDESRILANFTLFIRQLHHFLNQLNCFKDLQQIRKKWKPKATSNEAFGTIATEPKHWYTFNHGGRNEAQFNLGLYTSHFRVGLGFEFTMNKGGDPTVVQLAYTCFVKSIRENIRNFERFLYDNSLEVEWSPKNTGIIQFVPTLKALDWILSPPQEADWIFIGRLLKRNFDAVILENPNDLKKVIDAIFGGFRPIWEETQIEVRKNRY